MTYSEMIESCKIFLKYGIDDVFESDHDVIFGPNIDTGFFDDDEKKLEELGWFKDEGYDCWTC